MNRYVRFTGAVMLGISASLIVQTLARTGAVAGAATAPQNGDINGDGKLDLSDAVSLLNFLFKGGPAPVEIDCGTPGVERAQFRFLNDLTCNSQNTLGTLELCGGASSTMLTSLISGECQELNVDSACSVKASSSTPCGDVSLCADISVASSLVYDFVLTFDGTGPTLLVYIQPFAEDGSCPSFPLPTMQPTQVLNRECEGGGGGGGLKAGSWGRAGAR